MRVAELQATVNVYFTYAVRVLDEIVLKLNHEDCLQTHSTLSVRDKR